MSDKPAVEETQRIEVYDASGSVIIETETSRYIFNPYSAVELANAMLRCAEACGVKIQIEAERPPITALQRARLITRTSHVLRSLQGKKLEYTAMQVVDTILSELP